MNDLISRQAAIEAIEEYADRLQMVDWKENPGVPYKAYALNWCINTIRDLPPAQQEQRWIPCSERLPEVNGDYLVTGRQGAVNKRKYEDGRWYGNWAVLAWMPLPKPYKENSDGHECKN